MGSSESGATTTTSSNTSFNSNTFLSALSATEGLLQYRASDAQAKYTEGVYQANAELYAMQSADTLRKAEIEAGKYKKKVKSLLGSQRARIAASGVDISDVDSTAGQIQEETLKYGYQDVQQIKNNAFREALGMKTQGLLAQVEGKMKSSMAKTQGRMSLITGGLKAFQYGSAAYGDYKANNKKVGT